MRRAALPLLALCASLLPGARASAGGPEEFAFVEVETPRTAVYAGEAVRLILRIGIESRFLAESVVPATLRRLDVPVRVEAPWFDTLPGALPGEPVEDGEGGRGGPLCALNDAVVRAVRAEDRVRGGRTFTVLEIMRTFVPETAGALPLPAPALGFSFATRFGEDALGERVPLDPRAVRIPGAPLDLHVLPLPGEGRPEGFSGPVGRITARAELDRAKAEPGENLRLTITLEGEGNLARVEPPRLEGLEGFHVYGCLDGGGADRRTFTYDLAPVDARVAEVPAIPVPYFDPGPPPAYRVARTAALLLRVRPPGDPPAMPSPGPPGGGGGRDPGDGGSPGAAVLLVLLVGVVVAFAAVRFRRGRREEADPQAVRLRAASTAFRGTCSRPGADPGVALASFLADFLDCPPAAVVSADLVARLMKAGVPERTAAATAALLERLVAARFGGAPVPGGAEEARRLVEALEAIPGRAGP